MRLLAPPGTIGLAAVAIDRLFGVRSLLIVNIVAPSTSIGRMRLLSLVGGLMVSIVVLLFIVMRRSMGLASRMGAPIVSLWVLWTSRVALVIPPMIPLRRGILHSIIFIAIVVIIVFILGRVSLLGCLLDWGLLLGRLESYMSVVHSTLMVGMRPISGQCVLLLLSKPRQVIRELSRFLHLGITAFDLPEYFLSGMNQVLHHQWLNILLLNHS
jgi:hypothetical protein